MKLATGLLFGVLVVIVAALVVECGIDYFCSGCMVDYDYTVTTTLPDGRMITEHGTKCHQMIIHTKMGDRMAKLYPGF